MQASSGITRNPGHCDGETYPTRQTKPPTGENGGGLAGGTAGYRLGTDESHVLSRASRYLPLARAPFAAVPLPIAIRFGRADSAFGMTSRNTPFS